MTTPKPEQGRIVIAEVLDPQGRNPKHRPIVIISRNDEIQAKQRFWYVAITHSLPRKLTDEYVLLRYGIGARHPRTGLKGRSAARCDWRDEIDESMIVGYIGRASTDELDRILRAVEKSTHP